MLGYVLTKKEFLNKNIGQHVCELIKIYPDKDSSQVDAWKVLIEDVKLSNEFKKLDDETLIAFEYLLPVESMGIDLMICGKDVSGKEVAFVIESKQWGDAYIRSLDFSNYREEGKTLHPQLQVFRHYIGLKDYTSIGSIFSKIIPLLYIKNATPAGIGIIKSSAVDSQSKSVPVFAEIDDVFKEISSSINDSSSLTVDDLLDADYLPSKGIINAMNSIVTKEDPFILTGEQEESIKKVIEEMNNGKKIIRITGPAGSGKTAILLNLYVKLLNEMGTSGKKPYFVSGAQNTALYRSLYPTVEKSFSYSFPLPKMINTSNGPKTIILMDEAQHNESGIMTRLLNTGATLIVCYDPNQTINDNNSLAELSDFEKRPDFLKIELTNCVRYSGSTVYEKNVNKLLNGESSFEPDEKFEFKAFNSLDDLLDATKNLYKNHPNNTIAITGLLSNDADKIVQNSKGTIYTDWGNKTETRWIPYVESKNYTLPYWVGTWWLPGLDVDYVVLIVGGDAHLTSNGLVAVPSQAKHYAMMVSIGEKLGVPYAEMNGFGNYQKSEKLMAYLDRPGNELLKEKFDKEFSLLLKNNYYIMLTRARKGCFVYFVNNDVSY